MAHARPIPRDAPDTRATRPWSGPSSSTRRGLSAGAEEAEELTALGQAPPQEAPIAERLPGERVELAGPEIESAVEAVERVEDLGPPEVRIPERALLRARGVDQVARLEPAVALRLLE